MMNIQNNNLKKKVLNNKKFAISWIITNKNCTIFSLC